MARTHCEIAIEKCWELSKMRRVRLLTVGRPAAAAVYLSVEWN